MAIELSEVKWGSDEMDRHTGDHKRRRATEIVSANATCSECQAEWVTTAAHGDRAEPGTFLNGAGTIEVTCPNGHLDTVTLGPLADPR